jgi:hypothetical protein
VVEGEDAEMTKTVNQAAAELEAEIGAQYPTHPGTNASDPVFQAQLAAATSPAMMIGAQLDQIRAMSPPARAGGLWASRSTPRARAAQTTSVGGLGGNGISHRNDILGSVRAFEDPFVTSSDRPGLCHRHSD